LHFVSNEDAKNRLIQMGEIVDSVFAIGSPDVDVMLSDSLPSWENVKQRYDINFDKYGVFLYHPVTTEIESLELHINTVIDALEKIKMNFVVIYPNNDMGSEIIFKALKRIEHNQKYKVFPSLRFEFFLTLLKNAYVVIGNSSAGVREAPVFGIPTINIGTRQENRFFHSSIINVDVDEEAIINAYNNLSQVHKPSYHFGQGNSADQFMKIINTDSIWKTPCQKQFQDIFMTDGKKN